MNNLTDERHQRIHYALRIACAMCFIGHGAWGFIRPPLWFNYFAVLGIGHDAAWQLMPIMGALDILLGITLLFYPVRAVLTWLMVWGFFTALLRPLSGEPFAELIERAGNFGAPLALLLLSGGEGGSIRRFFFSRICPETVPDAQALQRLKNCLRIVVFLLLAGHGWLNLIGKKGLLNQYASLGFSDTHAVAVLTGTFEIIAAASVLIRPLRPVLIGLVIWKMGSELFYPHYELFQWLERGGSYGAILALTFLLTKPNKHAQTVFSAPAAPYRVLQPS